MIVQIALQGTTGLKSLVSAFWDNEKVFIISVIVSSLAKICAPFLGDHELTTKTDKFTRDTTGPLVRKLGGTSPVMKIPSLSKSIHSSLRLPVIPAYL
jgi:hypothetical protein